jgi:hypothetical protein
MNKGSIFKNEDVRGNNKSYSYGVKNDNNDVSKQLNNIFRKSKNKINIRIYLDNKTIEDRIIAKTEDYILTLNNNKIDIKSILKVEEI